VIVLSALSQERRQTHAAATTAAEEGARLALKAAEHAAKLREDAQKEREELKREKKLTFSQKVSCLTPTRPSDPRVGATRPSEWVYINS